jgi:hypothetical protein
MSPAARQLQEKHLMLLSMIAGNGKKVAINSNIFYMEFPRAMPCNAAADKTTGFHQEKE